MADIKDNRPLCEIVKEKEKNSEPTLKMYKASGDADDCLITAHSMFYVYKDGTKEKVF